MVSIVAKVFSIGLVIMSLAALGGFPVVVAFQSAASTTLPSWSLMSLSLLAVLVIFVLAGKHAGLVHYISGLASRVASRLTTIPLLASLFIGLLLRLVVTLWLEPQPASDGATYLELARQLAETGQYGSPGALAYWPPGMPLLLYPAVLFGLSLQGTTLLLGLGCFALSWFGLCALLKRLGCLSYAGLSLWLLALWPSYLFTSTLPEKELIVLALLPWMVERVLTASSSRGTHAASTMLQAGLIVGVSVLVQPSLQLLPIAILVCALMFCADRKRTLMLGFIGLAGAAIVVAGWTYRNIQVLHAPVLVSTNGGSVLYRVNNDLATGAYVARGSVDLGHMSELEQDREYKRLAFAWIGENPGRFVQLVVAKAMLFMGDDSYGPYAVFGRGQVEIPRDVYLVLKLLSTCCWLMLWAFILVWSISHIRATSSLAQCLALREHALVWLPVFYLFAIHCIFESGSKYHMPLLALILTWPALWLQTRDKSGMH